MNDLKVNNRFCFNSDNHLAILDVFQAFEYFNKNIDNAKSLKLDVPIFLDTNVLADYYRISFSERLKLKQMLEQYKDRIYITKQIEKEFLSNRIGIIKNFNKKLKAELENNFTSIRKEIENLQNGKIKGFNEFLNDKRLNDYPNLLKNLQELNEDISKKLKEIFSSVELGKKIEEQGKQINSEIDKTLKENKNIEKNDDILALFSQFKVTEELSNEELIFLRTHYNYLLNLYNSNKGDQNVSWKYTFPGCGEDKDKDDPLGDFIIFHEILKFMKSNNTDIIFLTNDVTKKDWVADDKGQNYSHYIEQTFLNSKKIMFICHAKNVFNITYEDIYVEKTNIPHILQTNNVKPSQEKNQKLNFALNDIEIDIIKRLIANQLISQDFIAISGIQKELSRIYPDYSIIIAMKTLQNKNFIEIADNDDYNGNIYKVCKLTNLAESYIIEHHNKFVDRYDNNGNILIEDDLPF